jgi:dCMP deaminase
MKQKFIEAHAEVADVYAQLSRAKRLNVGCVIVKDGNIIGIGYNGTPAGWDNDCEDKVYAGPNDDPNDFPLFDPNKAKCYKLVTKPEVIHAELNAIAKVAKSTNSSAGAAMFITHAPCMECSKAIDACGITDVFFSNYYRDNAGIDFLVKRGVNVKYIGEIKE